MITLAGIKQSSGVERRSAVCEIHHAVASTLFANAFGSCYWIAVLASWKPWRSVLSGIVLISAVSFLWDATETFPPFLLAWGGSVLLVTFELLQHRTFLTSDHIVVRAGFFRTLETRYPLREVQKVEYSYPFLGRSLGVGDIEVLGDGWGCSLVAVKRPEENARRILERKAQLS